MLLGVPQSAENTVLFKVDFFFFREGGGGFEIYKEAFYTPQDFKVIISPPFVSFPSVQMKVNIAIY